VFRLRPDRKLEPAVLEVEDLERVQVEGLAPAEARQVWFQPWVAAGKVLLARAASPGLAARFAAQLSKIQAAAAGSRVEAARELLQAAPGVEEIRARRAATRWHALALRVLCPLLFLVLFGLLPAIVFLPEHAPVKLERALRLWAVLHLWVVLVSGVMLWRGRVPGGQVAGPLVQMALFPPAAVRALATVTREIYAGFEPAAVAAALLDGRALGAHARYELRRLELSAQRTEALGLREFWEARRKLWDRALGEARTSSQEVLAPPARVAADATRYCPVCGSEYREGESCSDCRVPLVAFQGAA